MNVQRIIKQGGLLFSTVFMVSGLYANPVLDNVAQGSVSIEQTSTTTTVNQTSQQAIINWQSFNIQQGEHTHFEQPVNGVALNRINPNQGASEIYGHLSATGQIILINSAGVYIGPNAFINVGGLIASTAGMSDADFLSGNYRFTSLTPDAGIIINRGTIIAAQHGLIALLGNGVQNDGTIVAHLGNVVLGSGKAFTLTFNGNDAISFNIDSKAARGITHNGVIDATSGTVVVSAHVAEAVLDNIINLNGVVIATAAYEKGGVIHIVGDHDGGVVRIASRIDASGKKAGQTGGEVTITGKNILLDDGAFIDVSGDIGGGLVTIGGNYQGQGPLPNASQTVMLANAKINADAITNGNGGNIILWADDATKAYGDISAQGGAVGGNGGFVETSGKSYLDVNGIKMHLAAVNGKNGTWLLDPSDITISSATNTNINGSSPFQPSTQTANSILNVATLEAALASADVTVKTTAGAGPGNGDITVASAISWSSASTLYLNAVNDIIVNGVISAANGAADLTATGSVIINNAMQLASLAVNAATTTFNSAIVTTSGNQTYNSNLNTSGNATIRLTGSGNVTLGSQVSGSGLTIYGASNANNTLDVRNLSSTLNVAINDGVLNRAYFNTGDTLAWFNNINTVLGNSSHPNLLLLSYLTDRFTYSGVKQGSVNNQLSFTNFNVTYGAIPTSGVIKQASVDEVPKPTHDVGDAEKAYLVLNGDVTVVPVKEVCTTITFDDQEVSVNCNS